MKKLSLALILLTIAACEPAAPPTTDSRADVVRPVFSPSTSEAYDFGKISPYLEKHEAVYEYIDANMDAHLAAIQRWLRQPSISAQNVGIADMAELLRQDLENLGFAEAEIVPTDGHPGVWGYYDAGAAKTLVVYLMYDVQPVNPKTGSHLPLRQSSSRPSWARF